MLRFFIKLTDSLHKTGKMKDSITTGLLGGFIGTAFMHLSNLLIFKAGKTETLYGHIAGGLFVAPFRTKQRKNFILGEIAHFGIGSMWGIPLIYILKKTGKDYHLLKGTLVSMLSLGSIVGGQKLGILKKFGLTKTVYSAIWNHLVHGLVSAQAIVWLSDPTVFASSNEIRKETSSQIVTDINNSNFTESSNEVDNANYSHIVLH
ncbi:MAG: hypothetical protein Q8911_02880 [Bacillota bacterium]|nr:hypothetical protein [Bacillota bacterium]